MTVPQAEPTLGIELLSNEHQNSLYEQILQGLIDNTTAPVEAAVEVDNHIFEKTQNQYVDLKGRNPPFQLTAEEKDHSSVWLHGPHSIREELEIFDLISTTCYDIPPGHPAQDRYIKFIEALKALPRREVHRVSSSDNKTVDSVETNLMWGFGTDTARNKVMTFQDEAEQLSASDPEEDGPGVEHPGSLVQLRWRNLNSFMARLSSNGLIDLGDLSALEYLLPTLYDYSDWERLEEGPSRIEGDLFAAQHWLAEEEERRWVYERCQSVEKNPLYRNNLWTVENWKIWKDQMAFIAGDERFTTEARQLAKSLRQKMVAQEAS